MRACIRCHRSMHAMGSVARHRTACQGLMSRSSNSERGSAWSAGTFNFAIRTTSLAANLAIAGCCPSRQIQATLDPSREHRSKAQRQTARRGKMQTVTGCMPARSLTRRGRLFPLGWTGMRSFGVVDVLTSGTVSVFGG